MSFLRFGLSRCLKTQGLENDEGWGVFRHIQPPAQSLNSRPGPMRPTATNTSNVSGIFFHVWKLSFEGAARWSCQWRSMCRSRVFCPLHLLGGTESFSLVSTWWSPVTQQITVVSIGSSWQSLETHAKQCATDFQRLRTHCSNKYWSEMPSGCRRVPLYHLNIFESQTHCYM